MPDDPNNPGGNDPVKSYGGSALPENNFSQSGTGTPSSVNPEVQKMADAMQSVSADLLKVASTLSSLQRPAEIVEKTFEKWREQLKYAVDATDDVKDALKDVLAINKKFATQGFAGMSKKSYAEVKKYLDELYKAQKKLQESGSIFDVEENRKLQQAITHTGRALEKLEDSMKGVADANQEIDPDVFLEIAKNVRQATSEASKFGTSLGRGGKISTGIQQLAKIMGSGMFEKFAKAGAISTELGNWRRQVQKEGSKSFGQLKADFAKKYGIEEKGIPAFRATPEGRAAGPISGRTGLGGVMDRLLERTAGGAEKGGIGGFLGKQALATLEAGGGRAGTGIGMRALGGIAGAGEEVTGVVGAAAVPLALLEGVRKLVDMAIENNREFAKTLGTAGLFTGAGPSAEKRLLAAQQNLTSDFVSALGVRKEDNLKIVQAIEDLGVSMPELMFQQAREHSGILAGGAKAIGGVQARGYIEGRVLGLEPGAGAAEAAKYLLTFKQSQESVKLLFNKFTQDIKTSGITTTKYLGLIDEITSQFDRMGKSVNTVTGILRVLSSTGVASYDDLKEAMGVLIGGPEKSLEQTAFLYAQMGKQQKTQMAQDLQAGVAVQRTVAGGAMTEIGLDAGSLKTVDDVRLAIQKLNSDTRLDAKGQRVAESLDAKTALGALEDLRRQMEMAEHAEKFATGKESFLDYAQATKLLGNATTKQSTNMAGIFATLKASNETLDDVAKGNATTALTASIAQQLGVDPKAVSDQLQRLLSLLAGATGKALVEHPEEFNEDTIKKAFELAVENKLTPAVAKPSLDYMRSTVSDIAGDILKGPELRKAMETDPDMLRYALSNTGVVKAFDKLTAPPQSDIDKMAEDISKATLTTGDRMEDALARGFLLLIEAVTKIADFLTTTWGTAKKPPGFGANYGNPDFPDTSAAETPTLPGVAAQPPWMPVTPGAGAVSATAALQAASDQVVVGGKTYHITTTNIGVDVQHSTPVEQLPTNSANESHVGVVRPSRKEVF